MLDIKLIRDDPERIRKAIRDKQMPEAQESLNQVLLLDEEARLLRQDMEEKQALRNANSRKIGELKRKGESAETLMAEMAQVSEEVKKLEEKTKTLEAQLNAAMLELPNPPHESVPYGESEHDNVIVKEWGEKPSFEFAAKPHWDLASAKGWIDLEAGVKVAGAGFPVLRGDGARLMRSLVQHSLNILTDEGYIEILPPLLVNEASALGTGSLPDKEGQMYEVTDGFYLIPTSEVPVTNLHRDEIVDSSALPLRYTAHSPCFRREAGSYGAHVRGLNRVHQFDKVEMVQIVKPETSYEVQEVMTLLVEHTLEALNLPYRRLLLCTGDMTFAGAKTYDLEVWSAGQDRWLEVSSVTNFETFQSQRLKTRFREGGAAGKGKPELVHTLNGSLFGMVRLFAALLENNQQEDGNVAVPEILRPYFGKEIME